MKPVPTIAAQCRRATTMARSEDHRGGMGAPPCVYAVAMTVERSPCQLSVIRRTCMRGSETSGSRRSQMGSAWLRTCPIVGVVEPVARNRWEQVRTPTASRVRGKPNQGWARSQSFIRSRDKEDVLAYFETLSDGTAPSPKELRKGLAEWLADNPSLNRRLLERVQDPDLHDEFLGFLRSAWNSWSTGVTIARQVTELEGRILWDDEERRFDLIVDPVLPADRWQRHHLSRWQHVHCAGGRRVPVR